MTDKVLYLEEISAPLSVVPAGTRIEMSRPKEAIDIGHKPMTDTAKPTPWDKLTDETLAVFYEIGLTPRQLLDRLNFLQQGYSKTQHEIKQVLGKALGNYPWYKDDQKNFPNATDADGVCVGEHVAETIAEEAANVIVQLKEQRDELRLALNEIANSKFCNYDETSHGNYAGQYGIGVTDGHRFCANIANAALAKCGKVGG